MLCQSTGSEPFRGGREVAQLPAMLNAISSAVVAVTTVVYTIGTFLLWRATRRSLELTESQARLTERATRSAVLDEVFRSHREIFFHLLPRDLPLSSLWEPHHRVVGPGTVSGPPDQQAALELFGSILINHAARLFHHYQEGLITEAIWAGTREDIRDALHRPHILKRWYIVRRYHSPEFRMFADALIAEDELPSDR
jgi:hypothetical protein